MTFRSGRAVLCVIAGLALFLAAAAMKPAPAWAEGPPAITFAPDDLLKVVHGDTVVIASHARAGPRFELSITVLTVSRGRLESRVALADGQRFTIAVADRSVVDAPLRYRFQRTGRSVRLVLPFDDRPVCTTLTTGGSPAPAVGAGCPAAAGGTGARTWGVRFAATITREAAERILDRELARLPADTLAEGRAIVARRYISGRHLYVAQLAVDTRAEARRVCTRIIDRGGACMVRRN